VWLLLGFAFFALSTLPTDRLQWHKTISEMIVAVNRVLLALPHRLPISSQGLLALPLLGFAWLLLMHFVWREVSMLSLSSPDLRRAEVVSQPVVAMLSSTCFGYGTFFLFNWAGVYS